MTNIVEPETATVRLGGGVLGDNQPSLAVAGDFRFGDYAFGLVGGGALDGEFHTVLPEIAIGVQGSYFTEPLRLDIGFGVTQSSLLLSSRLAVVSDVPLADGWAVRPGAALTGGYAFGANCGGDFVICTHGRTEPSAGLEAALAIGVNVGDARVLLGATAQALTVGGDVALLWALVLQVEFSASLFPSEPGTGW